MSCDNCNQTVYDEKDCEDFGDCVKEHNKIRKS